MLINELAQWAVLIFVAVLALGLTRQLGNFIVPRREQIAYELGPDIGSVVGAPILQDEEAGRLREAIDSGPTDWGAIVVVDERCYGCDGLLAALEEDGPPEGAPVVALSRDSGAEHRARLERCADDVIVDADRLRAGELNATPFVMILDRELRVRFKDVLPDLRYAVDKWRGDERAGDPGSGQDGRYMLQVDGGG